MMIATATRASPPMFHGDSSASRRVYTFSVVNCTFPKKVNFENSGGKLVLYTSTSSADDQNFSLTDRIKALTESPGSLDAVFLGPSRSGVHEEVMEVLKPWIELGYVTLEYIYVPPKNIIKLVMDSLSNYSQFTIEYMPMSNKLCFSADTG
ncbi:hypothetical protein TorRG33x02_178460 [Trema orientale]|uniref:Uncharacterized protein n=1 Tax=Trema orientale TaxID=63057 RepID=A0A2P5ELH3_TREOI|nr:hypothetical protein TorRG33x02_178460 [Trema orientale]